MQFINEARRFVGTLFRHQGRNLGRGVDCAGVVIGAAQAVGAMAVDVKAYKRLPSIALLEECLATYCRAIDKRDMAPGDILQMVMNKRPQHLAIYTECGTIIHATEAIGRCVEHHLDGRWAARIVKVWRLKGLAAWR